MNLINTIRSETIFKTNIARRHTHSFNDLGAKKIIEFAINKHQGKIALVSSFGAEATILLHLVSQVANDLPIIFIDTEWHFPETIQYRDDLASRFNLTNIQTVKPDEQDLHEIDPLGDLHTHNPNACCALRKTKPLQRVLKNYSAWISGRKRFQTKQRSTMEIFESVNKDKEKINPLTYWAAHDVENYFLYHRLPRHPLWSIGYKSIGCSPCTNPTIEGEDTRAGRWAGCNKSECGIHL